LEWVELVEQLNPQEQPEQPEPLEQLEKLEQLDRPERPERPEVDSEAFQEKARTEPPLQGPERMPRGLRWSTSSLLLSLRHGSQQLISSRARGCAKCD
jgi:hypothetical protein